MTVREFNAPQRHAAKITRITHKRHVSVCGPQHVHPQTPQNCGPLGPLTQRTRNPKFLENEWCVAQSILDRSHGELFRVLQEFTGKTGGITRKAYGTAYEATWVSSIFMKFAVSGTGKQILGNRESRSSDQGVSLGSIWRQRKSPASVMASAFSRSACPHPS
jgi:hypothetical protein